MRDAARAEKDYGYADEIRNRLVELGYEVNDGPDGTEIRRR
jgi:cysteinyl-tRNA synthetase